MNSNAWRSPSNIALIKYWGKFGRQLPRNPSISFTLSQSHTNTKVAWTKLDKQQDAVQVDFLFEGSPNPAFQERIQRFLTSINDEMPFLRDFALHIESENSFPHSSGIASSASAMSALALCLVEKEYQIKGLEIDTKFYQRASHIARLGSGSASRSLFAQAAVWGQHELEGSNNEFAIPYKQLHTNFQDYQDTILIVDKGRKSVSSSAGHALMNEHPYAQQRFERAAKNLTELLSALKEGDEQTFIEIVEEEALGLHALMMACRQSFTLLKPNTLAIIEKLRHYRKATGLPICFTLDAGPNVHILYPSRISKQIRGFIEGNLSNFCQNKYLIYDHMGTGPKKLSEA